MTRYLTNQDYNILIQAVQLGQITQNNHRTLLQTEKIVEEEVSDIIGQRYDLELEFTNTSIWSPTAIYTAADRVYLDYATYSATASYNVGACTIYNSNAYVCASFSSATTSTPDQLSSKFTLLGAQYDMFYVNYPAQLFNYQDTYSAKLPASVVYWKGYTYSCMQGSTDLSETDKDQFLTINNIPKKNVFPDAIENANQTYWSKSATQSYTIPVGTLPTNTLYWTGGDNRAQTLILHYMHIVIYHLNKNLAPMNVPEARIKAYQHGIDFLHSVAYGDRNLNTLKDQPSKGLLFRWGSNTRTPFRW